MTTSPLDLYEKMRNNEDINVIDVREPFDFFIGHVPGALSLPRRAWTSTLGLTRDHLNVIYSHSADCRLANRAANYFAENDFYVTVLEGGFEQWKRHGLPVVK